MVCNLFEAVWGGKVARIRFRLCAGMTALVGLGLLSVGVLPAAAAPTGPVSTTPASFTPQLANTGTTQQVRQLVQCGTTMYAVGNFNTIQRLSTTYTRNNAFSFSAVAPYTMTAWNPNVNGVVNSIAFNGSDCTHAYIGGKFTSVDGTAVKNIAEVDTTTGAVVSTFAHSASAQVETLIGANGHLLVGGYYKTISNSAADPYMTSLDPTTGRDDGFLHLSISGNYQFSGVKSNATRVYNQSVSHSGQYDLVMGDFTSAGGVPRQQIFMLDLNQSRHGDGLDFTGVGRQHGRAERVEPGRLPLRVRHGGAVLSPGGRVVTRTTRTSTSRRPGITPTGSRPGATRARVSATPPPRSRRRSTRRCKPTARLATCCMNG